jgi:hypothetical protein
MIDSCMDNVLSKYLEGMLVMQDLKIKGLEASLARAEDTIAKKNEHIESDASRRLS